MSPATVKDRRVYWKIAAAGGLVLSAIGFALKAKKKEPSTRRVALIGDSYAVGLGPELRRLLPDFKFEGHVNTNTGQWAAHSSACGNCGDWLTAFKPDVVLVSLGVNDGAAPNQANYQTIVRALHGIGARVVWIEPPAAVTTAARGPISSLGVTTIPATHTALAADGLHPKNYNPWAQEIARAIS